MLLATLIPLPTYLALGARHGWLLELATHFRVLYLLALVPALLFAVLWRHQKLSAWLGVALAINLWLVAPLYFGANKTASGPTFRLLVANVLSRNQHHDRFLKVIKNENPDVIVLLEVNHAWRKSLQNLRKNYPHSLVESREDNFGIALFSRLPAGKLQLAKIGHSGVPSIKAVLRFQNGPVTLVATHPLPPGNRSNAIERNRHLEAAAQKLAQLAGPKLLVGDLNITPWSPYFDDLLANSNLQNSQQGFGVQPTWHLGLPIDHVLHSSDIAVIDRRVGPPIGSDHKPLILDLTVKNPVN